MKEWGGLQSRRQLRRRLIVVKEASSNESPGILAIAIHWHESMTFNEWIITSYSNTPVVFASTFSWNLSNVKTNGTNLIPLRNCGKMNRVRSRIFGRHKNRRTSPTNSSSLYPSHHGTQGDDTVGETVRGGWGEFCQVEGVPAVSVCSGRRGRDDGLEKCGSFTNHIMIKVGCEIMFLVLDCFNAT
jgi:hypothetical protein